MLGDFGASVIKIENLDGDMMRAVRPGMMRWGQVLLIVIAIKTVLR